MKGAHRTGVLLQTFDFDGGRLGVLKGVLERSVCSVFVLGAVRDLGRRDAGAAVCGVRAWSLRER